MTNPQTNSGQEAAGFTLLEMLVVLTVVAVATGLSFIGVGAMRATNTPEAFAQKIGETFVALRYRALNTGRSQSARFDVPARTVIVAADDARVRLPRDFSFVVTAGKEIGARDEASSITFLPDGSSSGVEISIADGRGNVAGLRVNWLTGIVEYTDDVHD